MEKKKRFVATVTIYIFGKVDSHRNVAFDTGGGAELNIALLKLNTERRRRALQVAGGEEAAQLGGGLWCAQVI